MKAKLKRLLCAVIGHDWRAAWATGPGVPYGSMTRPCPEPGDEPDHFLYCERCSEVA